MTPELRGVLVKLLASLAVVYTLVALAGLFLRQDGAKWDKRQVDSERAKLVAEVELCRFEENQARCRKLAAWGCVKRSAAKLQLQVDECYRITGVKRPEFVDGGVE